MLDLSMLGSPACPPFVPRVHASSNVVVSRIGHRARFLGPLFGQAAISVSNLAVGLLLAREAPKDQYGSFVLAFSITLLLAGIQDSLITSPVTVRAAAMRENRRARYFGMHARSSMAAWMLGLLPLASVAQVMAWTTPAPGVAGFALGVGAAAVAWMGWDFQRARALSTGEYVLLLRSDSSYLFVVVALLACAWLAGVLSAGAALTCIALAALAGWATASGRFPGAGDLRRVKRFAGVWWSMGRWSFLAGQVGWLQSQNYIYVTSAFLGVTALAKVAAARLLFAPLATFLAAWSRSFLPIAARTAAEGDHPRLRKQLRTASMYLSLMVIAWGGAVVVCIHWLETLVFAGKYSDLTGLAVAWGGVFVANYLRTIWQTGLRASGAFKAIFRWSSAGAVASLLLTVVGVSLWAELGSVLGLAVGELSLAVAFVVLSYREQPRLPGGPSAP